MVVYNLRPDEFLVTFDDLDFSEFLGQELQQVLSLNLDVDEIKQNFCADRGVVDKLSGQKLKLPR